MFAPEEGVVSMARCYVQRTCSHHESVLTNSKKTDACNVQRIRYKHGRRSYLSICVGGDSHSLLEWEPTRSKDRGLLSYNIYSRAHSSCIEVRMHSNWQHDMCKTAPSFTWGMYKKTKRRKRRMIMNFILS